MPEWSMDGDADELGTFDASGAFVSPKKVTLPDIFDFNSQLINTSHKLADNILFDVNSDKSL